MFEGLMRFLAGLQPEPNATPAEDYRWNRRIGLTLTALILSGVAFSLALGAAFGMVPKMGPGFVDAVALKSVTDPIQAQVLEVQAQISSVSTDDKRRWSLQLSNALIDAREKECHSKTDEGRQLYFNSIQRMMDDYRELSGQPFGLPACGDL